MVTWYIESHVLLPRQLKGRQRKREILVTRCNRDEFRLDCNLLSMQHMEFYAVVCASDNSC